MVLPGRNPVRLAKQLATLDRLSGGRLLITFVLGLRLAAELDAMGVGAGDRGRQLDELLPLLRRLWTEDDVDHDGPVWKLHGVTVEPKPLQQPLDVWLGGNVPGRAAPGRGPSATDGCPPCAHRRRPWRVDASSRTAASRAGRRIDPEHFGVSIGYTRGDPPEQLLRRVAARRATPGDRTRPRSADIGDLVPDGIDGLRRLITKFVDVGFSKFVVRPVVPPASFSQELKELADGVLDLQT